MTEIDEALKKFLAFSKEEIDGYVPLIVAEILALKIVKNALDEEGLKGAQLILERVSGRALTREKFYETQEDLASKIQKRFSGG